MKGGRLHHVYNFGGLQRTTVSSTAALGAGRHTVRYDFVYDGGPPGSGGTSRLSVDGQQNAEAKIPRTMPFMYSADEGIDIGVDSETPVTEEYAEAKNRFSGRIYKVTVEAQPPTRGT
jgi:arylsulfatase